MKKKVAHVEKLDDEDIELTRKPAKENTALNSMLRDADIPINPRNKVVDVAKKVGNLVGKRSQILS